MKTPEDLAYAESVRAIEHQARGLDELRARTGVLLAAAAITASLLGAQVAKDIDALSVLGLLGFLGGLGA